MLRSTTTIGMRAKACQPSARAPTAENMGHPSCIIIHSIHSGSGFQCFRLELEAIFGQVLPDPLLLQWLLGSGPWTWPLGMGNAHLGDGKKPTKRCCGTAVAFKDTCTLWAFVATMRALSPERHVDLMVEAILQYIVHLPQIYSNSLSDSVLRKETELVFELQMYNLCQAEQARLNLTSVQSFDKMSEAVFCAFWGCAGKGEYCWSWP